METPKSVQLLLVRHGQAQSNVLRILTSYPEKKTRPLTALGREQAARAAKHIVHKQLPIKAILASPLTRTQETAGFISEALNIRVTTDIRLRETDFGKYDGTSAPLFFLRYPHPRLRRKGNETLQLEGLDQVRSRAKDFLRDMLAKYAGDTVVVVSHGDFIREVLGLLRHNNRYAGLVDTGSVHKASFSLKNLD